MPKISAVIITYNEESFIDKCLASIDGVADEIVVVDSFSTDRTEEICKKYNTRFIKHKFEGYRDQKNFAIRLASHENILSLDADEALSDDLRESILAVKDKWEYDGYLFNRRNNYCGKWIRHSEWYPDRQLRLFHANDGKWGHWPFTTLEDHNEKMKRYSQIGAEEFHKAGKKANIFTPYIHLLWGFFRSYIIKGGFLDGHDGYLICSIYAKTAFNKYKQLRQLNKHRRIQ
jgi:glycosyltransferase involved in cell wall biosynthesis